MQMAEIVKTVEDEIEIYSRTSGNTDENEPFSAVETLSLLDSLYLQCQPCANIGYITEIQKLASSLQEILNSNNMLDDNDRIAIAGSFAEGIFIPGHSDVDIMLTLYSLICCDVQCLQDIDPSKYSKVYIADTQHTSPGYTFLIELGDQFTAQARRDSNSKFVSKAGQDTEGQRFLDVALKQKDIYDKIGVRASRQGPALQILLDIIKTSAALFSRIFGSVNTADLVSAISYESDIIKQSWLNRKRKHGWPPEELQRQISKMKGHVVPVGTKNNQNEGYEWRICYTQAEIKLAHSLNEVQLMLYIKLKLFSKTVFKEACQDITSYIIKNIIFWLAESIPNKYFQCRYFIPLFRATLVCLRTFVTKRYLPNYMIPQRNLFAGKLIQHEQEALVEVLSYCIEKYPMFEGERGKDILRLYEDLLHNLDDRVQFQCIVMRSLRVTKAFLPILFRPSKPEKDFYDLILGICQLVGMTDTEKYAMSNCFRTGDIQACISVLFSAKQLNCFAYICNLLFFSQ
ncbi:uncharacterized protein LOC128547367 [Mercenaria mercenaria]|uniref:uncharacterized protein LOC128547367 n=1 Tax=Mercenaria mercenaria TaxID=6596 RepID=UPI00234E6769|nr:uncharacterized protein LOC128547367 [Mercenaria mercenaria]XP_053375926.1 uncharacterized protein LOC128547367 [Mercenaria mercenaria]